MSDLQELITTSSMNAYNQGIDAGERLENARIVQLLINIRQTWQKPVAFNYLKELDNLIELVSKK